MRESLSRAAVVHAARALLSSEGPGGLSLRRLASRLDVTAAALYAYVDNKGDLLSAVLESEYDVLSEVFARHRGGDPLTRLCSVCWSYVHHARGNAKIFRTMFMPRGVETSSSGYAKDVALMSRVFEATLAPLVDGIEQGLLRPQDPQLAHQTLWTTVHGTTAVLLLAPTHDAVAAELSDSVIRTVVRGLCTERGVSALEQVQMPALAG